METISPFSVDANPMLLGNNMDVTDRMEAEERLRVSENLYRTIFETTGTAMIILEEDTTVALVNTEFESSPAPARTSGRENAAGGSSCIKKITKGCSSTTIAGASTRTRHRENTNSVF